MEDYKRHQEQLFAEKGKKFWEDEIIKLPEKCQKMKQNNKYIFQNNKYIVQ